MVVLCFSIAWAAVVALLLFRAIRQYSFYQVIRPDERALDDPPTVAIIIPARNEGRNIRRCLEGLLAQEYPHDRFTICVVDDNSTDDTATVVKTIAQRDRRVRLIPGKPLPPGWTGKSHACWQGAEHLRFAIYDLQLGDASTAQSQISNCKSQMTSWLCFLDADTVAEPMLLRTAVRAAMDRGADLLSLEPFQELGSPWERLILPAGFFLIAFTQDVRRANDPASPEAHANGQFLLIRQDAYEAVGTFAAVRSQIAEDSALARLIKRSGRRVAVLGTQGLIRTRMYRDFTSLWQGLSRQAGELLGSSARCVLVSIGGLILGWAPVAIPAWGLANWIASRADTAAAVALPFAVAGSLALWGTHIGAARYFKIPLRYGLLFPLGYTLGAGIALHSAFSRARGRVAWKGREYTPNVEQTRDWSDQAAPHDPSSPVPRTGNSAR